MKLIRIILTVTAILQGFTGKIFAQQGGGDVIAEFIKNNPDKSAIYLVQDGKVLTDINADRKSPLASTVKIIVAIEYAVQSASGNINPSSLVDTAELDKYYIPNTDGDAHPTWLEYMQKRTRIKNGKVTLEEVAKGMIDFSSNANTEYLLDLLSVDNVNKRLQQLGLENHDKLYYLVGSLGSINGKEAADIENMSMEEYIARSYEEHDKLKTDPGYKNAIQELSLEAQKVWSDRLPAATPKEYVSLLQKINSRTYFDEAIQKHLAVVMERLMDNPANQQWLKHAGMKGGSTLWVLTKAIYATTTTGETTELAYFFNNLKMQDVDKLGMNMNSFELAILTNRNGARDNILKILNGQ